MDDKNKYLIKERIRLKEKQKKGDETKYKSTVCLYIKANNKNDELK